MVIDCHNESFWTKNEIFCHPCWSHGKMTKDYCRNKTITTIRLTIMENIQGAGIIFEIPLQGRFWFPRIHVKLIDDYAIDPFLPTKGTRRHTASGMSSQPPSASSLVVAGVLACISLCMVEVLVSIILLTFSTESIANGSRNKWDQNVRVAWFINFVSELVEPRYQSCSRYFPSTLWLYRFHATSSSSVRNYCFWWIVFFGYGALLSQASSRLTFPDRKEFCLVQVYG